jgi:predicted nuclease with TOPRIM domain
MDKMAIQLKEAKVLNTYLEEQQRKISELIQQNMMLETKIKLLKEENSDLRIINNEYREKYEPSRLSFTSIIDKMPDMRKKDIIVTPEDIRKKYTKISGFNLKAQKIRNNL